MKKTSPIEKNIFAVIRAFLTKFNYLTVDRIDFTQNIADTQHIAEALEQGSSIVIFPEGTFTYATGLRSFKYGAFKVAVDTATPICPIAIDGTRHLLRAGRILPRRSTIKITISEPIAPRDKGWHEVVRLRTEARAQIAKGCGEQALEN